MRTPTGCRWLPWDSGGGRRREGSISCWEGIRDETPLDDSLICHSGWFDHNDCVYPSPKPCWALSFHQMRWICKDLVFSSTCATHQLGSLQHIEGCQKSLLISMQKREIVVLGINFAHKVLRPWLRGIYLGWCFLCDCDWVTWSLVWSSALSVPGYLHTTLHVDCFWWCCCKWWSYSWLS